MISSESVQVEMKVSRRNEYECGMQVKFDYSVDFQKNFFLHGNDCNDLELIVCLWVVVVVLDYASSLVSRRSDIHHDDDADENVVVVGDDEMRMI
mmetsp:Transcript_14531/g.22400  ORF Transcript_14531/g.22400 Transcript_14531/m.22400 type:complete len:95 (+) Transcript_14531:1180-1464(+)